MNLLIDTHIFLWFIAGDRRLPAPWRDAIQNPLNQVYLSSVSLWECVVKFQLGKLPLPEPPHTYIPRQRVAHRIASLPLDEPSIAHLAELPLLHRDPFDRMIMCQAIHSALTIVTMDEAIRAYSVPLLD